MRLDQWLWAVRVFKTRSLAVAAIRAGPVRVNGENAKPAREPRAGELVTARIVAGKLVPEFAEDLTPPEELEKLRALTFGAPGARARGSGRPTKRERRELDEWAG